MGAGTNRAMVACGVLLSAVTMTGCGGDDGGGQAGSSPLASVTSQGAASGQSAPNGGASGSAAPASGGAGTAAGSVASSPRTSGPDATTSTPLTAVVPANCDMPSMRLVNGETPASYRPKGGGTSLHDGSGVNPLIVDLAHKGSKQVLWTYGCSAGGVSWPETLVLSDAKGELVGSVNLGDIARSEHAGVEHWSVKGNTVAVDWIQYEGAGFDRKSHSSTLAWKNGKLTLTENGTGASTGSQRPGVPANAAPGAGGPRPANATELTESTNAQYASEPGFKSPSGKNGCEVFNHDGTVRCGTTNGELFLSSDGKILGHIADDAPMWPEATTLAYGQVRYHEDTVFASTDQGVTVWNTKTGHGALINTDGVHQF